MVSDTVIKKIKSILLIGGVSFTIIYTTALFAATPNPGHPWREVGDGIWATTGTTALRTFTFPDASSTVLTTNALVTVAQGGTGQNSTSSAMTALSGLASKGDMFIHNGSIAERLAIGANNLILLASSSKSTGVVWTYPIVSPAGSDTWVQFNDGGVFGATSTFTFDKVTQTLGLKGELNFTAQSDPSTPAAGTLNIYAKTISGRTMLKAVAPSGVNYAYQPSFFQNQIFILSTGAGTAYTVVGNVASSTGTVSHVVSEPLGYMANQVTAASATGVAGTFSSTTQFYRGTQVGSNGFFFQARMSFPTATSSTYRVFVGLKSGDGMASVSADNPAGDNVAFQYSTSRADTGWKFMTKDGTTQNVSSTLLPFSTTSVYDFFIYCPPYPNNGTIYYRIDNLTTSTTVEGSTSTNLPTGGTLLRAGFFLGNITGVTTRNIRVSRLYVETDK
jgi:hypothetical protein